MQWPGVIKVDTAKAQKILPAADSHLPLYWSAGTDPSCFHNWTMHTYAQQSDSELTAYSCTICIMEWKTEPLLFTSAKKVMFLPVFVCLSVCDQDYSKSYGRIFLKFWGYVGHGINYKWFNSGRDPAGILDSGSLWNFRYHCIEGGIR